MILMVAFLKPSYVDKVKGAKFVELFAGRARTTRLASWAGYKVKSLDYIYSSAFNFLKPSGFVLLVRIKS